MPRRSTSDENLASYIHSDDEGQPPLKIPFQKTLKEIGVDDGLPWFDLYGVYSEYTHPKFSIVRTSLRVGADDATIGMALYDEWQGNELKEHWETARLCMDRIATILIAHFGLDLVLLQRLEQLANDPSPFRAVAE